MTDEIQKTPAPQGGTATNQPEPQGLNAEAATLDQQIDRETSNFTRGTVEEKRPAEQAAATPKRKRGRPRKIQVDALGAGSSTPPNNLGGIPPGQAGVPPVNMGPPALDPETVKAIVGGVVGLLDEVGQALVERVATVRTGDEVFASKARKQAVMSIKTRTLLETGASGVVRKYSLNYTYVEETALVVGVGIWALGISAQVRAIKKIPLEDSNHAPADPELKPFRQ